VPRSSEHVNPPAGSTGGQARTRFARRAVVDAAAVLFAEHGYAATTVDAVSERSKVPPATVYRLFGSKLGILKAWLDVTVGGDDAPVAVADRPHVAELLAEIDPQYLITGFAGVTTTINRRSNVVYRVLVGAAAADSAAAGLLHDIQQQRADGQRRLTQALERLGALRVGLNERRAADAVYAIMSPETYRLLVIDRHWSARRYRDWLRTTLYQQLLA